MQIGATTVENSMEFPQKIKSGTAFCPSDPTFGTIKNPETPIRKNIYTPVFIEVLPTMDKV